VNESVAFKTAGNQLFKEGNYEAALEKYQQAIVINQTYA
jgi:tetratricopeptide (TPR) repeat protein